MTNTKIVINSFRRFVSAAGRDEVGGWYDSLPRKDRARFRVRLEYLRETRIDKWQLPDYRPLTGACKGLGELRRKIANSRYRVIGFFGPNENEFSALLVWEKKSPKIPRRVCETAQRRKKDVIDNRERAHEWIY